MRDLSNRFTLSEPVSKAHGKLFVLTAGPALAGWEARPKLIEGGFQTVPGVFSADAPDRGSALLADALPPKLSGVVVDLGAGYAPVQGRTQIGIRPEYATLTAGQGLPMQIRRVEDALRQRLGTDVRVTARRKGRGAITVSYYSNDDLSRLLELMLGAPFDG